jgi:16S rRNA processing protein RimM
VTEKFIIGLAGTPFGLNGFVKVRSLSGEIEHLLKLKSVLVRQGEKEQLLKIEENAASGSYVLMRFAGINSPEEAKTLNGAELLASREQAAPLLPGEFYIEDLKGLAILANEEIVGHITDIIEGGGGDLAEIMLSSGEKKLVPFRKEFISGINPEKGSVTLQNTWILE